MNESSEVYDGEIRIGTGEDRLSYSYDPWSNTRFRCSRHITLEPRKSLFLVADPAWQGETEELPDPEVMTAPQAVRPDMFGNTYEPDCGSGITGRVYLIRKS